MPFAFLCEIRIQLVKIQIPRYYSSSLRMHRPRVKRLEQHHVFPHGVYRSSLSDGGPAPELKAVVFVLPQGSDGDGKCARSAVYLHEIPDFGIHYQGAALIVLIPVRIVVKHHADGLLNYIAYLLKRRRHF